MKKVTLIICAVLLYSAASVFAGNGDLIVDGKLGVGTISLDEKVTVRGLSQNTGIKLISGYPRYGDGRILAATSGVGLNLLQNVDFSGNLDDTTMTGQQLKIGFGNGGFVFNSYPAGINPRNATTVMVVRDNGNVGIGTTSPITKLSNTAISFPGGGATDGLMWRSVQNDYAATIIAAPSSGYGYGLRLHTNGTSQNDSPLVVSSGEAAGTMKFTIRGDGNVGIGTASPGFTLDVQGTIGSNNAPVLTSDAKFKTNLQPIDSAVEKVKGVFGYSYEWKTTEYPEKHFQHGRHYGVIAQDIEKVLPEVVNTAQDGTKAVAYTEIIPVLIEAIKEQQKQIDELKKLLK